MYQWTDGNGNIHFSNTQPPAHNKNVIISTEIVEDPVVKQYRLEQEAMEEAIEAEQQRQHQEQLRIQRDEEIRLAEIRRQEEISFRRSRPDLFPPKTKIDAEKHRLAQKVKKDKARCSVNTGQGLDENGAVTPVDIPSRPLPTKTALRILEQRPELADKFKKKYGYLPFGY